MYESARHAQSYLTSLDALSQDELCSTLEWKILKNIRSQQLKVPEHKENICGLLYTKK